ncbi:MAG: NAD(+)/NADH kinase, partial [Clostridia bacterium]|nr:NAD(+)/NADH kinase [Clostridia bacterium]
LNAGRIIVYFYNGELDNIIEAEVMDIDEEQFRNGVVTAKLFGYMMIPNDTKYTQSKKFSNPYGDKTLLRGMAKYVVDEMKEDIYYIVGSGSTTKEIMDYLGLKSTLLGIDVIKNKELVLSDATESELLDITKNSDFKIIVSIIGGQGYIFGRGNQQLSPSLIKRCGKESIIIVSSLQKLVSLEGKPLLVDTGDDECDMLLKGVYKVIVGYGEIYAYYC